MKTRNIIRLILTICLCAVILVSCNVGESGDTGDDASSMLTTDLSDVTDEKTETFDVTDPLLEYVAVESGHIIYHVFSDHAVAAGADIEGQYWNNEVYMSDTVNGVAVTEILDGAFDNIRPLRIYCDATYDIYDTARAYAVEYEHIFIEMNSGKYPDHYYPDWVEKLDWQPRDKSKDKYIAEDDNAEISALVGQYLSGGDGYDELLQRIVYRYVCCYNLICCLYEDTYAYPLPNYDRDPMSDHDRYIMYTHDYLTYYQWSYGGIDTYEEIMDYVHLLFTDDVVETMLFSDPDYKRVIDLDGYVFAAPGGPGSAPEEVNPEYGLIEITKDRLVLRETREVQEIGVWEPTGNYVTHDYELLCIDGEWRFSTPHQAVHHDVTLEYEKMFGNK